MGCKSSKSNKKIQTICYTFEKTKVPQLDEFFNKASILFEKAEIIRKRFVESAQESYQLAGTYQIRTGRYIQTIKVLFWAASANCQGQILRSGLKLIDDPPFISLSANGLDDDIQAIYKALRAHFDVIVESPEVLSNGIDMITRMNNELMRIAHQITTKKKFAKIIPTFMHNAELFRTELAKMKRLYTIILSTRHKIEKLMPKVRTIARKADRIGIKAHSKNIHKPMDIFEQYIMLPKKNIKNDIFLNIDDIEIDESIHDHSDNEHDNELDINLKDMDVSKQSERAILKKLSTFTLSPEKIPSAKDDSEDEKEDPELQKSGRSSPEKLKNHMSARESISKANASPEKPANSNPFSLVDDPRLSERATVLPIQSMAKDLKDFASAKGYTVRPINHNRSVSIADGKQLVENGSHQNTKRIHIDIPERKNFAAEQSALLINQGEFSRYRYSTPLRDPSTRVVLSAYAKAKSPLEREGFYLDANLRGKENSNSHIDELVEEIRQAKAESKKKEQKQMWYGDENIEDDEALKNLPGEISSVILDFSEKRQNYLINMKS